MSYKNTDLKRTHHAMKTYLDGMRKAKAAQDKRAQANTEFSRSIQTKYPAGQFSQEYYNSVIYPKLKAEIDAHNERTKTDFIRETETAAAEMLEAAKTLKENADFRTQALDFDDQRLINALKMLDAYGKDMPYAEQANLCYTFRGDMPALRAIENGMKKNGMRYSQIAHDLQKTIDGELLDEMQFKAYQLQSGNYTFGSYETWFTKELTDKAEAYGLDLTVDPYREAIRKDAYGTGVNSGAFQEQQRQSDAHKLLAKWEKELQEMEAAGNTEQANRSAKQIYDVLAEDGIKFRE